MLTHTTLHQVCQLNTILSSTVEDLYYKTQTLDSCRPIGSSRSVNTIVEADGDGLAILPFDWLDMPEIPLSLPCMPLLFGVLALAERSSIIEPGI